MILRSLIDRFSADPSDEVMGQLIESIERNGSTDEDLAYLTIKLAESGETLDFIGEGVTADIASTGGPSSLSTLLCPLYLRCLGFLVPALAVPGRPAGGIDVLAQIPGYKVDLTRPDVVNVLQKCGYAHFIASRSFVPLDAMLFSFRKKNRKINIPELAIASLLAKKIAAGVSLVGLDIRVARHGNFGTSTVDATRNAERFCRIASLLNRKSICFLSDASRPYQPFIGRGEALVAMWSVLSGTGATLRKHDDTCYAMANRLAFHSSGNGQMRPTAAEMNAALRSHLEAQGSNIDALTNRVRQIEAGHVPDIVTKQEGFLHVDLGALRSAIVSHQDSARDIIGLFSDPCGVILISDHGNYVRRGDLLATVRYAGNNSQEFRRAIFAALTVKPQPVANLGFLEVSCG